MPLVTLGKMMGELMISTTEMHTGGEPLRIIKSGYPEVKGKTLLEKLRFTKENLDYLRTFVIHEPRGHYDQYGALLVQPDHEEADIGVIFMHNEGYSTMCGHAVIALGRYIVDNKLQKQPIVEGLSEVVTKIQCPCGLVEASVKIQDGKSGAVKFTSVPAFAVKVDETVDTTSYGTVTFDLGYGGAFYVLIDVNQVNLDVRNSSFQKLIAFASEVFESVKLLSLCEHPEQADLSFLYGVILTDGKDMYSDEPTDNLCIFADKQVDRSPCGSGTTARMAVHYAKKQIRLNQSRKFRNAKVGSVFKAEVVAEDTCGKYEAVRVQVEGEAFYTGTSEFFYEERDNLKMGFMVK